MPSNISKTRDSILAMYFLLPMIKSIPCFLKNKKDEIIKFISFVWLRIVDDAKTYWLNASPDSILKSLLYLQMPPGKRHLHTL